MELRLGKMKGIVIFMALIMAMNTIVFGASAVVSVTGNENGYNTSTKTVAKASGTTDAKITKISGADEAHNIAYSVYVVSTGTLYLDKYKTEKKTISETTSWLSLSYTSDTYEYTPKYALRAKLTGYPLYDEGTLSATLTP